MAGIPNIFLFDPDVMEESNRNRLPFCQSSLNRPKVEIVAEYIRAIRPDCTVVAIQEKLEGILLDVQLGLSNLIIEATDSPKTQLSIFKACKNHNIRFIRAGYDGGTHFTITSNVSGWIKTDVEEETYAVQPSWVGTCLVLAGLLLNKIMRCPNQEVSADLDEIGIAVLQRPKNIRLTPRCNQEAGRNRIRPS